VDSPTGMCLCPPLLDGILRPEECRLAKRALIESPRSPNTHDINGQQQA